MSDNLIKDLIRIDFLHQELEELKQNSLLSSIADTIRSASQLHSIEIVQAGHN